jgi:ABC-type transport system involved in multi-copper enzyme maturation permease subunit
MVLEREILPYFDWLFGHDGAIGALPRFFIIAVVLGLLALVVGYVIVAARHGLLRGGDTIYRTVSDGFRELIETSPRRVWALVWLAIKEARRRRVEVALIVFVIILAFANWFLSSNFQDPAKLYVSFVLTATTYLVLGIALLLSAFSLPGDFKSKTIYTVVTKPVRGVEIILGRILGFAIVGTVMLAIMAVCSYIFVVRSLDHTHEVEKSLTHVKDASGEIVGYTGRTTFQMYHRHDVQQQAGEAGVARSNHGHAHEIESLGDRQVVGGAEGFMRARWPQWGGLRFLDSQGSAVQRGINVGSEWTYRSFITGNSQAAAIWTFDNVSRSLDPDSEGLPIGLIVEVFKTHKGIIGQPISGAIQLQNPDTNLKSELISFAAQDNKIEEILIKTTQTDLEGQERNLYDDFVSSSGQLEIRIQCLEKGQYFGFAPPDCYLRLPDRSPLVNIIKVYSSIWVQMVIVISIGVAASALLSGPVAMLLTVSFILLGFFREFFVGIAAGPDYEAYGVAKVYGGGPLEALVRIVTQKNVITPLEEGFGTTLIQSIDWGLQQFMLSVAQLLPDFSAFSTVEFAAYGFSVPPERVAQDLTVCLGYVVGMSVIGYFLLRTREVAK